MEGFIRELECDCAVVGSGSGMVAAVRAAKAGKKVVVLEKTDVIGGGMLFAQMMRTFGSKWQKKRNIPDVTAKFVRRMLDECYWRIEPKLVSNIIQSTGETFDWILETCGIPEDAFTVGKYVFDDDDGPLGPFYGVQHNGFGRLAIESLYKLCPSLGVEVLREHRVVDCEVDGGRISALIAEAKDGRVRVRCKACLLAPGAWIRNDEIAEKVCPGFTSVDRGASPHTNPAYTGDGIPIAEKAGALVDYDSFCVRLMGPMFRVKNRTYSAMTVSPYSISVNLNGERYASEPLISHMNQFDGGHVIMQQPKGKVFAVFSENILRSALEIGDGGFEIPDPVFAGFKLPETLEEAHQDIRKAETEDAGKCFRANSPEELADQMGVNRENFLRTVEEYNSYCANGFDWGFYKPEDTLIPLREGPYYAVSGFCATDGGFGGVKVNADMQAYARGGGVVEGLYVTGDFASGRHYNLGGVKRQFINDMNWALAGSYIVGDRVVKYLNSLQAQE